MYVYIYIYIYIYVCVCECVYNFVRTVSWSLSEGKYSVHNRKEKIKKDWQRNTCAVRQGNAETGNIHIHLHN